jgi:hypothetical protein
MVATNMSPLITSVDLRGSNFIIGQVDNLFSPFQIDTYYQSFADVTYYPKAGFACFSPDGINVERVQDGVNVAQYTFVGFAAAKTFTEGDPGTNPYYVTSGNLAGVGKDRVPVLRSGSIWVAASNNFTITQGAAQSVNVLIGLNGSGSLADNMGTIYQGTVPSNYFYYDITTQTTVRRVVPATAAQLVMYPTVVCYVLLELIRP